MRLGALIIAALLAGFGLGLLRLADAAAGGFVSRLLDPAQVVVILELMAEHFPAATRITRLQGGFLLWAELPAKVDSVDLHHRAIQNGISICPGVVFSATGKYRNCARINCGLLWTPR